jgi:hypothetical protein
MSTAAVEEKVLRRTVELKIKEFNKLAKEK